MKAGPLRALLLGLFCATPLAQAAPVAARNTPEAIILPLRAGATLESVLSSLNERGFHVVYSNALVLPTMTLRAKPAATRIDELLAEILAPWNLRAVHAANGDWLIVAAVPKPEASSETPVTETIETVDVTASRYALATVDATSSFLNRKEVERLPHLGDDAVRMLKVLPGVTGGDFSAALNIRGGRRDETLLMIDGAEIHNGFHFRDLDGALSVLDTHLVHDINFITGGMTAEHGDYMSGVVDLHTRNPRADDDYRSSVGLSFVSLYGRTGGTFADERGSWLASARRGYLDLILKQAQDDGEQLTPRFTDVFASINYDFSDDTSLSLHTLLGTDNLLLVSHDEDETESAGKGEAQHVWFTLDHAFSETLRSKTVLAASHFNQTRDSAGEDDERVGDVLADFDFQFLDLRQDWSWTLSDRHLARFGFNANRTQAQYDYSLTGHLIYPTGNVDLAHSHFLDISGTKYGVYGSWRAQLLDSLTTELGGRWDKYAYPNGLSFNVVSPRFNLVHALNSSTELRFAWSVVNQPQGIDQLQIEDNLERFFEPERCQQFVLGWLRRFESGLSARIDFYRKQYSHLRPRFENALDSLQLIPEGAVDRIRIDAPKARTEGVEFTLRREAERGLAGWVSISVAKARDHDQLQGWTARTWEQSNTLSFGSSWTGSKWNVSLAGIYHDGAPTTELGFVMVPLPSGGEVPVITAERRNDSRLGPYTRIDLRANRDVQLRNGRFSYYLEVTNLFNIKNPCCVENYEVGEDRNGRTRLLTETTYGLPMLPSFGFQYSF